MVIFLRHRFRITVKFKGIVLTKKINFEIMLIAPKNESLNADCSSYFIRSPQQKDLRKGQYVECKCNARPGDAESPVYSIQIPYFGAGAPEEWSKYNKLVLWNI